MREGDLIRLLGHGWAPGPVKVWCEGDGGFVDIEVGGLGILVRVHRRVAGGSRVLSVLIEGRLITLLENCFEHAGAV